MIDQTKMKEIVAAYKRDFPTHWPDEKYKWEAVKTFQDNWDIDADDFPGMLTKVLSKTDNLLRNRSYYPAGMIEEFAEFSPEEVRAMFVALYDEERDIIERILEFKNKSADVFEKYNSDAKQHYQDEHAITTYLWLRYPNKYYIYKISEAKAITEELNAGYIFKKGAYADNLKNFYALYDEICEFINTDTELTALFESNLTDACYPDPEYRTLAADIGFYINNYYHDDETNIHSEQNQPAQNEGEQNPVKTEDTESCKYSKKDFLSEVFMDEAQYDMLFDVLKEKKNIILQGPPGVGKTFAAKRLAYSVMGEKDDSRIGFVQFHQNYTYEDFIMGYKPTEDGGFKLKNGIFYEFCKKASNQPGKDFFFIIDEINRGNMSKIFGELLMLIENDYRGKEHETTLAYSGEPFSVPKNLYIIGMMNTADRSLAMIDYALRRRFSFFDFEPGFESKGFKQYQKNLNNKTFNKLITKVEDLNEKIANDKSLGKDFRIGHSYFSNWDARECTKKKMQEVVNFDIIPMLKEYWFDEPDSVQNWQQDLMGVFND